MKKALYLLLLFAMLPEAGATPENNPPLCQTAGHLWGTEYEIVYIPCCLSASDGATTVNVPITVTASFGGGITLRKKNCTRCGDEEVTGSISHAMSSSNLSHTVSSATVGIIHVVFSASCNKGCGASAIGTVNVFCNHQPSDIEHYYQFNWTEAPSIVEEEETFTAYFANALNDYSEPYCTICGIVLSDTDSRYDFNQPTLNCYDSNGNLDNSAFSCVGFQVSGTDSGHMEFVFHKEGTFTIHAVDCTTPPPAPILTVTVYADDDNDGLFNSEEIEHNTDPENPDSDGDGLTDGDEVKVYHTNPNNNDTDGDGMKDGDEIENGLNPNYDDADEDLDGDGLTNIEEVNGYHTKANNADTDGDTAGDGTEVEFETNPRSPALTGNYWGHEYRYDQKIHENAEDGDIAGWTVPAQYTLTNQVDPDNAQNRILSYNGTLTDGAQFNFNNLTNKSFKLAWRIKTESDFKVEIECTTTGGPAKIVFNNSNTDSEENGVYYIGLGDWTADGNWHPVLRDMQREIWKFASTNTMISIDSFKFCGNGSLDDLRTMILWHDNDRDCIPDSLESAYGLDPSSHLDANGDLDSDGLSNYLEFVYGANMNSSDSDSDGLTDIAELQTYHTNPASKDSDGDGMDDGWEIAVYGNQSGSPEGDHDNDGLSNFEEYRLPLNNSKTHVLSTDVELIVYPIPPLNN